MRCPSPTPALCWMLLLGALVALSACGSSAPETRYYQMSLAETPLSQTKEARGELSLSVDYMSADPAYDDTRMVYRKSPYQLDYYHYHRWSSPPSMMVSDMLRDAIEATGDFRLVTNGFVAGADVLLRGRLLALEEVDVSESQWRARVVLDLQLQDVRSGLVIWSSRARQEVDVADRTPEGVARALSQAIAEIAPRITQPMIQATRQARRAAPSIEAQPELDSQGGL